jgi:hypothetical protein
MRAGYYATCNVVRTLAHRNTAVATPMLAPELVLETLREITNMLKTIAIVLVVLWALGLVSSYTMGGFIHVLLVIAVVFILIELIQGRRVR